MKGPWYSGPIRQEIRANEAAFLLSTGVPSSLHNDCINCRGISVVVGAGVAWTFIYGDDSWPDAAERVIMALSVLVAVASVAALMSASYFYGKRRESSGGLSKWHVTAAVATAILLPAVMLLRQYRIGAR